MAPRGKGRTPSSHPCRRRSHMSSARLRPPAACCRAIFPRFHPRTPSRFHRWRRPRLCGGRHGVKLGISDTHKVINADCAKVLDAFWQSCRVDVVRNALAHAGKTGRRAVSAFIATGFARSDAQDASAQWRQAADNSTQSCQSSPPGPKTGVVARMIFPTRHRISHARSVRSSGSTARPSCGQRVIRFGCDTSGGLAYRPVGRIGAGGVIRHLADRRG